MTSAKNKINLLLLLVMVMISGMARAQSYEMKGNDTINRVDQNNLKQGKWFVTNAIKKLADYQDDQLVEEGVFIDGKKQGLWKMYHPNTKLKSELTYENNRPKGYAKFYHENGNLAEEGQWENNKWVGAYKMYYENGQLYYDFKYTEDGKRTGEQKYYHDNGNVMIEGAWNDGKETGVLKEYYYSGAKKSEKVFNNGTMDATKIKEFTDSGKPDPSQPKKTNTNNTTPVKKEEVKKEEKKVIAPVVETPKEEKKVVTTTTTPVIENKTSSNGASFVGNGYNKLYKNKQVEQEGEFKNYKLWDGKRYEYEAGKLVKIITVKEGKVSQVENK